MPSDESGQRKRKRSRSSSSSSSGSSSSSSDSEAEAPPPGSEQPSKPPAEEPLPPGMEAPQNGDDVAAKESNGDAPITAAAENGRDDIEEVSEDPKPRALHKTASIFLRNLAPTITKAEVEAVSFS